MKTSLACSCSTGYVYFARALLKSVKATNGRKYPFIVFCHGPEAGVKPLFKNERDELKAIYQDIEFRDVPTPKYWERFGSHYLKYFSLEAFGLEEYDTVIYFGADMLNVKPLTEMEEFPGSLCMTREMKRRDTFNNGGMIIRKPYLSKEMPETLARHGGRTGFGNDQALIASFFDGKITEAPNKFNTMVTERNLLDPATVVNWHFFLKPNEANFADRCGRDMLELYDKYRLMP